MFFLAASKQILPRLCNLSPPAIITVHGLSKHFYFDRHRAKSLRQWFIRSVLHRAGPKPPHAFSIENLNLSVYRGESVGIVGGNGSGKSTLLRIIAGIYQPSTGEVDCLGKLAAVLELGAGFHKELTGADNIATYAAAMGLSRVELRKRWSEIVAFADIGEVLDKPIKHYSTGMQARLALGVALCGDFDILLLDEALSVGDQSFRHKVEERLKQYHADGGTLIFVSHDLNHLRSLCSRVIWLRDGRVVADGDTDTVLRDYENTD
jgi:lipopolysaccharide transport system ATP-binding protein